MAKRRTIQDIVGQSIQAMPLRGKPLIEILGTGRVLIENHSGICSYFPQEVVIRVQYGLVKILGDELSISMMNREQVVVSGIVCSLELMRRQEHEDP